MNSDFGDSKIFNTIILEKLAIAYMMIWCFIHFGHREDSARLVVFLCRCRLQCPVKTCTTLFNWGFLRWRKLIVSRKDLQPTDFFILKQFFRLFHIYFHLSANQSLTVLTQLAYGTVIKGSGPCIFDLDVYLATLFAASSSCTQAWPGIQAILMWFCLPNWFGFLMQLSTVIDVTVHFMSDLIAAQCRN